METPVINHFDRQIQIWIDQDPTNMLARPCFDCKRCQDGMDRGGLVMPRLCRAVRSRFHTQRRREDRRIQDRWAAWFNNPQTIAAYAESD